MRVLLNTTSEELEQLGGDFTLYQDWLRLDGEGVAFQLVVSHPVRRWHVFLRKVSEKLCRTWQPAWLRRCLLLISRFLYVPSDAVKGSDLIFSHILFPWMLPHVDVPTIWSSQGISPAVYYERYNRGQWTIQDVASVYRTLGRRADALVISTETCARNVVKWCPELTGKVHIVPGPVFVYADGQLVKPSRGNGVIRLLFVGVDATRKGLPEVVEAFRILRSKYSDLHLDVVSRPSTELRERIEESEGISLHLSSPEVDVKSLMAGADIFLLPTHADTYALAAVEAMAYGCAIITSDLEPLPEIIPDGEVGFVVPPGDVEAIVRKTSILIENPALRRNMQEAGRRRYQRYHAPEVVMPKLRTAFEAAIRHHQKRLHETPRL